MTWLTVTVDLLATAATELAGVGSSLNAAKSGGGGTDNRGGGRCR
nr:hypothetical protein [Mycobacterium szulgai]